MQTMYICTIIYYIHTHIHIIIILYIIITYVIILVITSMHNKLPPDELVMPVYMPLKLMYILHYACVYIKTKLMYHRAFGPGTQYSLR